MDESTVVLQPHPAYGWSVKGSKPTALFNYTRKRFHMFGALGERSFYCRFAEKINQNEFIEFLKDMKKKRGKVLLLMDNARWHKSKKVGDYVHKHELKLAFFPAYTPELNPIEIRWREIKKELGNRLFYNVGDMKKVVLKKIVQKDFFMNKMFHYLCP